MKPIPRALIALSVLAIGAGCIYLFKRGQITVAALIRIDRRPELTFVAADAKETDAEYAEFVDWHVRLLKSPVVTRQAITNVYGEINVADSPKRTPAWLGDTIRTRFKTGS